jgi:hypothetical protein
MAGRTSRLSTSRCSKRATRPCRGRRTTSPSSRRWPRRRQRDVVGLLRQNSSPGSKIALITQQGLQPLFRAQNRKGDYRFGGRGDGKGTEGVATRATAVRARPDATLLESHPRRIRRSAVRGDVTRSARITRVRGREPGRPRQHRVLRRVSRSAGRRERVGRERTTAALAPALSARARTAPRAAAQTLAESAMGNRVGRHPGVQRTDDAFTWSWRNSGAMSAPFGHTRVRNSGCTRNARKTAGAFSGSKTSPCSSGSRSISPSVPSRNRS